METSVSLFVGRTNIIHKKTASVNRLRKNSLFFVVFYLILGIPGLTWTVQCLTSGKVSSIIS